VVPSGEKQADEVCPGEREGCFAMRVMRTRPRWPWRQADSRRYHPVERRPCGRPMPRNRGGLAVRVDGPDGVVGRKRRTGDVERACGVEGEVIGRDAGLEVA